jgi:hypothetical protein
MNLSTINRCLRWVGLVLVLQIDLDNPGVPTKLYLDWASKHPLVDVSIQEQILDWCRHCFGTDVTFNMRERAFRLLEETCELCQSAGLTATDAQAVLNYTFSRPVEPRLEIEFGGVGVTLYAMAGAWGIDLDTCIAKDFAWCLDHCERIANKHWNKPSEIRGVKTLVKGVNFPE